MASLFRAEWKKITGNFWLTCCTIWIFPILGVGVVLFLFVIFALYEPARSAYVDSRNEWTYIALAVWGIPNISLSRLLLMGFVAMTFAGEYQNQTWKMVLPGNRRTTIILVKFLAIALFILMAFSLMMVLLVISFGVMNLILGAAYPPALSGTVIVNFLRDLLLNATVTFATTFIIASIAALAAILTRSVLYSVMISVFIALAETLGGPLALQLLARIFQWDRIADLYLLTPAYSSQNILSWINDNRSFQPPFFIERPSFALEESILILGVWLITLVGLAVFTFQGQDIQ